MSRIIKTETPAMRRRNILKLLASLPIIEETDDHNQQTRNDILAFIILSLAEIEKTLQESIGPWEKRGFWNKAENLKKEWGWVVKTKNLLIHLEKTRGWEKWPFEVEENFEHFKEKRNSHKKSDNFWEGSYQIYLNKKKPVAK